MNRPQDITAHDAIDEMLPWYVNDTLDDRERQQVDEHLLVCSGCRKNVEFLQTVQDVARHESPAPIVPAADVEKLLAAATQPAAPEKPGIRRIYLAVAASVIAVVAAGMWLLGSNASVGQAQRFETVISPASGETVQYIVDLTFADGTAAEAQRTILATMTYRPSQEMADGNTIRLHVEARSLSELQQQVDDLRALPEVSAADVVAVHLPVE